MEFDSTANGDSSTSSQQPPILLSLPDQEANGSFTKNDNSFGYDNDNLNLSQSSDKFQTPSAKLQQQYDEQEFKQDTLRASQIRQSLFQIELLNNQDSDVAQNGTNKHLEHPFTPNFSHSKAQLSALQSCSLDADTSTSESNRLISFSNTPVPANGDLTVGQIQIQNQNNYLQRQLGSELQSAFCISTPNGFSSNSGGGNEVRRQLIQTMAELEEKQNRLKELEQRLETSEQQLQKSEEEKIQLNEQIERLQDELKKTRAGFDELNSLNREMAVGMNFITDAFEREVQAKDDQLDELNFRYANLFKEKEQTAEDLQGVEASFSNLHHRFEKMKSALEQCRQNEESYKGQCLELSESLEEKEKLCALYQSQVEKSTENAKHMIETSKRSTEREFITLRAQLKKTEMRLNGLQAQLDQKISENTELNKMIDELTNS